jgi:ferric-chelate reductase
MCRWAQKWDQTSAMLGMALPFTVSVLFVPVARGSPILRLIDVPFEQAVKYHRWFGYLTVLLVFIHGSTFAIYLGSVHQLHLVRVLEAQIPHLV